MNRRENLFSVSSWAASAFFTSPLTLGAATASNTNITANNANSGTQELDWLDADRKREIEVLARWPQGAPMGVVVFSHGLGGKRTGADVWGQAWSKAGYLTLHLQHAGSDSVAIREAGGVLGVGKLMSAQQLAQRVGDVQFTAQQLRRLAAQDATWKPYLNLPMFLAGHSFGAHTAMASAGAAYPGLAKNTSAPLFRGFIALSPSLGLGGSNDISGAKTRCEGVHSPFLLITGSLDGEILGNRETPSGRKAVFDALPNGQKSLLWLHEADHFSFAGNSKQIPSTWLFPRKTSTLALENSHHALVANASVKWLNAQTMRQTMMSPTGLGPQDQWQQG